MGPFVYNLSIILCWRRTRDSDHKFIKKRFTEVTEQVRSRVIVSWAYIQSDLFLKPAETPPSIFSPNVQRRQFTKKVLIRRRRRKQLYLEKKAKTHSLPPESNFSINQTPWDWSWTNCSSAVTLVFIDGLQTSRETAHEHSHCFWRRTLPFL